MQIKNMGMDATVRLWSICAGFEIIVRYYRIARCNVSMWIFTGGTCHLLAGASAGDGFSPHDQVENLARFPPAKI